MPLTQLNFLPGIDTENTETGAEGRWSNCDKVRFRKKVRPGDTIDIYIKVLGEKRGIWKFDCRAELDRELVCSAIILCADRKAV